jgi:hypothetical protein
MLHNDSMTYVAILEKEKPWKEYKDQCLPGVKCEGEKHSGA